jgi:hypothetical protein
MYLSSAKKHKNNIDKTLNTNIYEIPFKKPRDIISHFYKQNYGGNIN